MAFLCTTLLLKSRVTPSQIRFGFGSIWVYREGKSRWFPPTKRRVYECTYGWYIGGCALWGRFVWKVGFFSFGKDGELESILYWSEKFSRKKFLFGAVWEGIVGDLIGWKRKERKRWEVVNSGSAKRGQGRWWETNFRTIKKGSVERFKSEKKNKKKDCSTWVSRMVSHYTTRSGP